MKLVVGVVLVTAILIAPSATRAQHLNDDRRAQGADGTVLRLVLENENGEVTITAGRTARVTRTERWNLARPNYRQRYADGTLTVRASCPDIPLNNCAVDLDVVVPGNARIHAENVNGDVEVTAFSGRRVDVATTNGSVGLNRLSAPVVRGSTDNGEIRAAMGARPRDLELSATNGDVEATMPKGAYTIDADTSNGDVSIRGLEDNNRSRRQVSASTTNGDVTLTGT